MAITNTSRDTNWKALAGYPDDITRSLNAAKTIVAAVPEGARPSALALIDALSRIRGVVIVAADMVNKLENGAAVGMKAVMDAAGANVRAAGPGRPNAVSNAKQALLTETQAKLTDEAVAKVADRASDLQERVRVAALDFQRAVDRERNRADELMPKADSRDGAKMLAERYDFDQFRVRLEADGLEALAERYLRAVRLEDHDLARMIEAASAGWLLRVLQNPRVEAGRQVALAGRTTGRDPHTEAVMLLGEMRRQQEARRPPESKTLEELHELLNRVFVTLVGTHARFLAPGESYERVGLGPWDLDSNWVRRYLPPRPPLPGYGRIMGYGVAGQPVRMAAKG